jgi:hypothetical protein
VRQELKDIIQEIKSIQIANKQLNKLKLLRIEYLNDLELINESISKSSTFIDSLNKVSFYSIYTKLIRKRQAKLTIHKSYFLKQSLNYNEVIKSIELVDFEIEVLSNKSKKLKDSKDRLKELVSNQNIKSGVKEINKLKKLFAKISKNLALIKEFEEAIQQGVVLNRIFNKTINHLKKEAHRIFKKFKSDDILMTYDVRKIQKYQENLISLKHNLIKYEVEVQDVYKALLKTNDYDNSLVSSFIQEYRFNLLNDLTSTIELNSSFIYLKNFKSVIMSLTKNLRKDLKSLKRDLAKQEIQELKLIFEIEQKYST